MPNDLFRLTPALPQLVGILAPAHSGKDTFADRLVAEYGFVRVGLADILKRFCQEIFGLTDEQAWGPGKDDRNPKYVRICQGCTVCDDDGTHRQHIIEPAGMINREPMQLLGTEFLEQFQPPGDFTALIVYARRVIKHVLGGGHYDPKTFTFHGSFQDNLRQPVVVADIRKPNEVEMIHQLGGVVVRLYREGKGYNVGVAGHKTETAQRAIPDSDVDYIVNVQEGIPNYHVQIDEFATKIGLSKRAAA